MKSILCTGLILLVLISSGCIEKKVIEKECKDVQCPKNYELNKENCNCRFIGRDYPGFYPCNLELSQRGLLDHGVNNKKWINVNTLEVDVIALINCAFSIRNYDSEVKDGNIILRYTVSRPPPDEPLLMCLCGHEIVYHIENLDKEIEYKIELKEKK